MHRNKIYSLLFFTFWCFANNAYGQDLDRVASVSFEELPLTKVLTYLTEHYSLQFSYSKEQIPLETKITLTLSGVSVKELISTICDKANLEYKFIDGLIVIRKKITSTSTVKPSNNFTKVGGIILDSASGKPLPFANVFFDNSSFGMITDSLGKFVLNNVPIELRRLVVSYIGYRTLLTNVDLKVGVDFKLIIKLQPEARLLSDVVVLGERDKDWLVDFQRFKSEILGRTANTRLCTIQNPSAVELMRAEEIFIKKTKQGQLKWKKDVLKAHTREPLEIINQALGYRVKVLIEKFQSFTDSSSFLFYAHFDTLQPSSVSERFRWELNRLNAYTGSQTHLFRSVLHSQTEQEGFEISESKRILMRFLLNGRVEVTRDFSKISDNPSASEIESNEPRVVLDPGEYLVLYKRALARDEHKTGEFSYPTSLLGVVKPLLVNLNGTPSVSDNHWRTGYFDRQRIADRLPDDYDETKSRKKIVGYELKRVGNIGVVIVDATTSKPISNVLTFINKSSLKMQSDKTGRVLLENVPLGNHEVVFFKAGYILAHTILLSDQGIRKDTIRLTYDNFEMIEDVPEETRHAYLAKFRKQVFGAMIDHREITNPSAINITYWNKDSIVLWSLAPIKIIDSRLGFKINFFFDKCRLKLHQDKIDIHGYSYFEDEKGIQKDMGLEAKRLAVYDGSFLNFSRSLVDGRIAEEGFKIYAIENKDLSRKRNPNKQNLKHELDLASIEPGKDSHLILKIPSAIEIHYNPLNSTKTRISTIVINQNEIPIDDYGIALPFGPWHVKGDMEEKGLLPKLPINFKPFRGTLLYPF